MKTQLHEHLEEEKENKEEKIQEAMKKTIRDHENAQWISPSNMEKGIDYEAIADSTLLLIVTYNRADYLKKCLSFITMYHPAKGFPMLISQDGFDQRVQQTVEEFQNTHSHSFSVKHIHHPKSGHAQNGYFALSEHYKFALSEAFSDPSIQRVIVLEEDLQISVDFFEYFLATSPLLDDPSQHLLAVSAWNDNGFSDRVKRPEFVFRSDFFPGLGWMLGRSVWEELSQKWPRAYWDDWLREDNQRQQRHILHPEISRTFHFGTKGTSNAQYGDYLNRIKLNDQFVHFSTMDLTYLDIDSWEKTYLEPIYTLPILRNKDEVKTTSYSQVRVEYSGNQHFEQRAREFGIMDNIKANVPRTAYKGVVSFWFSGVLGEFQYHIT